MQNLHERLVAQLDALVAFLALAHEEVFEVVREHYQEWVECDQQESVPDTFQVFQAQIANSAFLLGYSYFEAFLAGVIRQLYMSNADMLPKDKELKYADIMDAGDYESVVRKMIDREVLAVLYSSMESVATYFERKLQLKWPRFGRLAEAARLRNCIVHNMSRADARLAEVSKWKVGELISLTAADVHDFGVDARAFAEQLYPQVEARLPVA